MKRPYRRRGSLPTGRAGESLHQTVYSTFEWLFRDLPEISPKAGNESKLLAPIIAALGADGVSRQSILAAVRSLKDSEEKCSGHEASSI